MSRRTRIEAWLNRRWYGARPIWWLLPFSVLFGAAVALRRALYRMRILRAVDVGVPVVVVGNLTAGGSGKTPVTLAVVAGLRSAGFTPGIVSRGYGARVPGVRVLRDGDSADAVGDEPALMAGRRTAPVAIGADRVAAAKALRAARPDVDVLVSDDGLQHYRLARTVELVVVDGRRGLGNGALQPAGPLREPRSRLNRADAVLCNGSAREGMEAFKLVPGSARRLDGAGERPLAEFRGTRVHAVAGIGDPRRFFDMLARLGVFVTPHPFPDHHRFRAQDIDFDDGAMVLMTEKDAVKCLSFAHERAWFVPVDADLPAPVHEHILARLRPTE
ncbi:MAG: tetraacyldisaccharide 4'-kinase [Gammaproteobacteria bacterium]